MFNIVSCLLFFSVSVTKSYASENRPSLEQYPISDSLQNSNKEDRSDSIQNSNQRAREEYLPISQFTYSGDRRYTIDGSLPNLRSKLRPVPASIVGGLYLGTLVFLHFNQQNAWWSDNRGNFHFQEDWVSALQVDKAGHAFGGYIMSYMLTEGLTVSGLNWEAANIFGSSLALAYQTYVEVEDGYAKKWGFSPSDWYFDAMGPIFFLSQHYVPALQKITPKWQFVPSEWTDKPKIVRPRTFIDDYNSSTFWWSFDVYNILPQDKQKYWPKWLNLALGYGGDAIDANTNPDGPPDQLSVRRYIVGLDFNLARIIPETSTFLDWFKQSLNYIKLPAPAVEFTKKGTKLYLLYPFRISLGNIKF
ncbi:MAG: DUF2279 domain-containing protein [Bacteroidota bacterium]|nr:DUF2279 domain-containing protein [Bacteroidota bacterium]MDP4194576.1 DUF2279 domain-containing protein [Bacteroidota bacterium]